MTQPLLRMPEPVSPQVYDNPADAVAALRALYERNTGFLRDALSALSDDPTISGRFRACYPQVTIQTTRYDHVDSRLAYGHVTAPGVYSATVTRPDLFKHYLTKQLQLLSANHGVGFTVSTSDIPIPIHFAVSADTHVDTDFSDRIGRPLRDIFDVPDLNLMNDDIVNGEIDVEMESVRPLAQFTAPRTDYSLARLQHYTATRADEFQNFVLFTNYQFYVDEFVAHARARGEGRD
ncbi:MAG: AMP nucleosidase, partial [Phyllobacteriaceae bacterium]|nr:AMP nucleosidase [Phyllobacteriaceae bacterium]